MTPEERFKKLAERRAKERAKLAEQFEAERNIFKYGFLSGALDPVLEKARKALYRTEAYVECYEHIILWDVRKENLRDYLKCIADTYKNERAKFEKIISENN